MSRAELVPAIAIGLFGLVMEKALTDGTRQVDAVSGHFALQGAIARG